MVKQLYSKARFINDNTGRGTYQHGPSAAEGKSVGPDRTDSRNTSPNANRSFNPQRTPFSSASRPTDRAVTSENYGEAKGGQPR